MPPATALFGKLPGLGDFVARGLPPGLRAPLDRWLTTHLARHARAPETWPAAGLRATLILNGTSLTALILPSSDRAGRAFPLACCHLPGLDRAAAEAWCAAALPAALAATEGMLDPDALIAALPAPIPGTDPAPGLWTADSTGLPDSPEQALARIFGPVSSG
jgi:type VI secretion system protein ImpM